MPMQRRARASAFLLYISRAPDIHELAPDATPIAILLLLYSEYCGGHRARMLHSQEATTRYRDPTCIRSAASISFGCTASASVGERDAAAPIRLDRRPTATRTD
ncbi:unnamed protein product [Trichogramma brassicae]|uniref:Uncharacterized protein n=1 Tax=Trichogramma brassicae TaxID=86971 RepID=A0A6H5IDQ4_9HYME|nr:unnamed protein product [Trichogramma brassicae]